MSPVDFGPALENTLLERVFTGGRDVASVRVQKCDGSLQNDPLKILSKQRDTKAHSQLLKYVPFDDRSVSRSQLVKTAVCVRLTPTRAGPVLVSESRWV